MCTSGSWCGTCGTNCGSSSNIWCSSGGCLQSDLSCYHGCNYYTQKCSVNFYDCSSICQIGMLMTTNGVKDDDNSNLYPYVCQYPS